MSIRDGIAKSLRWIAAKTEKSAPASTLEQARAAYLAARLCGEDEAEIVRTRAAMELAARGS